MTKLGVFVQNIVKLGLVECMHGLCGLESVRRQVRAKYQRHSGISPAIVGHRVLQQVQLTDLLLDTCRRALGYAMTWLLPFPDKRHPDWKLELTARIGSVARVYNMMSRPEITFMT